MIVVWIVTNPAEILTWACWVSYFIQASQLRNSSTQQITEVANLTGTVCYQYFGCIMEMAIHTTLPKRFIVFSPYINKFSLRKYVIFMASRTTSMNRYIEIKNFAISSKIASFLWPTWGPFSAPWTLLSGSAIGSECGRIELGWIPCNISILVIILATWVHITKHKMCFFGQNIKQ